MTQDDGLDDDGDWMVHDDDASDLWEPTDDVEVIEDATEERLRWRVIMPNGKTIGDDASGFVLKSRSDAVGRAFAPGFGMSKATFDRLSALTHEVAGWSPIGFDGWKIEPVGPAKP